MDAETAHEWVATALGAAHRHPWTLPAISRGPLGPPVEVLGLVFRSPVLLAAGFDKAASMYNALGALGFAGVEVGTITAHAQPGNERPRLFRLPRDRALINRMGFNNRGAEHAAAALAKYPRRDVVVGVNIGKSKITPIEEAAEDYAQSARFLSEFADYLVINVSSPNTPGLRSLQNVDALRDVVCAVRRALEGRARPLPLLLKIAPDLTDEAVDALAAWVLEERLDGVIATNTTISREGLATDANTVEPMGAGGLSGPPLRARTLAVIRRIRKVTGDRVVIVAAGGIETAEHAWDAMAAGASLVQIYTGFVYGGPTTARTIESGLVQRLRASGSTRWVEIVGSAP